MTILLVLIPVSLILGLTGLVFFVWSVKNNQYDDPQGAAERILEKDYDTKPKNSLNT